MRVFPVMPSAVSTILERIVAHKRAGLGPVRAALDFLGPKASEQAAHRRDFESGLTAAPPAIISELKKASPSKGLLAADYAPAAMASAYESGGAAALSVLTDSEYFQGKLGDLEAARAATRIPVLRKDFTVDRAQIVEAAAHGADAILLIAAILTDAELRDFRELAATFKMASLVEVHDAAELQRAIDSGAQVIGVNNRDLRTFEVRLETSLDLAARMPAGVIRVAESGIVSADDVRRLSSAGYHAFLVGEHLMKSANPAEAIRALRA